MAESDTDRRPAISETTAQHALFLRTRIFGSLNGLRALSILVVVWHHTAAKDVTSWKALDRGFLGVDLFFEISGFLIVTLLLREQCATRDISLRDFYIRRSLRIFPAYGLMLAIVGAVAFLSSKPYSLALRHDFPWALFYVSNLVPMPTMLSITWSLSTEEQFYLVIPWLQKLFRRLMPWIVTVLLVLAALPVLRFLPSVDMPGFFRQSSFVPILLGVALAQTLNSSRGFRWVWQLVGHRVAPWVSLALLVVLVSDPDPDISGWPRLLMELGMLLLLASCVVREDHGLAPVLKTKPLDRLGTVSYGAYLYHLIVLAVLTRVLHAASVPAGTVIFIVVMLGSWIAAELSYRFYERPFLALKHRFAARQAGG